MSDSSDAGEELLDAGGNLVDALGNAARNEETREALKIFAANTLAAGADGLTNIVNGAAADINNVTPDDLTLEKIQQLKDNGDNDSIWSALNVAKVGFAFAGGPASIIAMSALEIFNISKGKPGAAPAAEAQDIGAMIKSGDFMGAGMAILGKMNVFEGWFEKIAGLFKMDSGFIAMGKGFFSQGREMLASLIPGSGGGPEQETTYIADTAAPTTNPQAGAGNQLSAASADLQEQHQNSATNPSQTETPEPAPIIPPPDQILS